MNTVLERFKKSVSCTAVPDETEIMKLGETSHIHYLTYPFLAGLGETFQEDAESARMYMSEKQKRQALAFYYSAPIPTDILNPELPWYGNLVKNDPEVVSDVLIKSVRSMMRKNMDASVSIQRLVLEEDHAEVARLATLPILKSFPTRCRTRQLRELNYLLRAALCCCDKGRFLNLVRKKVSSSSMNIPQRVYWLATGLILSPPDFREEIKTYLTGYENRIRHLGNFFMLFPDQLQLSEKFIERLDVHSIKLLVRMFGSLCEPVSLNPAKTLSSFDEPWKMAELTCKLVQQLVSVRFSDAADALEELSSDNSLRSWNSYILNASYELKSIRRELDFRYPDVKQVLETLKNERPANPADLSALIMDILNDLARNIRDGNTSDWRQYWNMNGSNPTSPHTEGLCRDALLSDLRRKLELLEIDAQPEGRYADDKRSDIRIAYDGYNIPVEIKKSGSKNLWSAIENQLIAKYARDPGTDGYGIYLVFWFGRKHCRPPGEGTKPRDAGELQERLLNGLNADQKRKISVCVIDVANSRAGFPKVNSSRAIVS